MKKILMVLILMLSMLGIAKTQDNYDYDKYVGYYVNTYYDGDSEFINKTIEIAIKKDKKGDYIFVDYRMLYGSGYAHTQTIEYYKLIKDKGTLKNKKGYYVFKLKNNILLFDNEKYRKINDNKIIKEFLNGDVSYAKYRLHD